MVSVSQTFAEAGLEAQGQARWGSSVPHAGGWPLKMLSVLDDCWVYFAASDEPAGSEAALLRSFAAAIPSATTAQLHDPSA